MAAGGVLPPNSSSTDIEAVRRGMAMRPESLRLADKPMGALPALAALLVLVLFESLMLVPATGAFACWCAQIALPKPSRLLVIAC